MKKTKRVSKQEWLAAALAALKVGGVDAVRVERLAKTLDISKSGFYWHFKNRGDLLAQLLEYWETEYTKSVRSDPRALKGTPEKRLHRIIQMIESGDLARYDIAFHAWASNDKLARETVDRVMRQREAFVGSVIREMGFEGEELEMLTMLFVIYNSCEKMVFGFKSKRKRGDIRRRLNSLICGKT